MNRETKRMLQRQGELGPDGAPARRPAQRPQQRPPSERTGPRQFTREVRGELRRVAWPSRAEVRRFSLVVVLTLLLVTGFIAGLDVLFGKTVLFLFDT